MISQSVRATLIALFICGTLPGAALGQKTVTRTLLPDSTIARVIDLYNDEGSTRFRGESRIATGTIVSGDVVSLNGPLSVGGHVEGDIVVINGDLFLTAGSRIDGSVTTIGGMVQRDSAAVVAGDIMEYREPLRYREENGLIALVPGEPDNTISAGYDFGFGRTDLLLAVRGAYNRVDGLPVAFGPRGTFGSAHPTRVQALLIYHTGSGITADPDDMGYFLNVEQYIGGGSRLSVFGSLYRERTAIEDLGLRDREASLAAFVLHRDYRDHYERRGWSVGTRLSRAGMPYDLRLEFRNESNRSVAPADPFTLLNNDAPWRPEPLVSEGRLHSVTASLNYDTRNDVSDPADGWYIRSSIERGFAGSLESTDASLLPKAADELERFTAARFDIRRYARLAPYARLSMRVTASGSLDGNALPAQRQQTLGGEGTLPGYAMFSFDCDARTTTVLRGGTEYYPYHGCDRLALMQVEYQASFPFARRISEKLQLGNFLTHSVRWAAFVDAGRAWTEADARNGRGGGSNDFSADAGLGLRLGTLGIYWAVPLSGAGAHQYNVFIRLGPRL